MQATIYSDGTYLQDNPQWHADDAAWKAGFILRMLERHRVSPKTSRLGGCSLMVLPE